MSGDSAPQRRATCSGEYRIPGCNDADADLKRPAPGGSGAACLSGSAAASAPAWHWHTIAQTL